LDFLHLDLIWLQWFYESLQLFTLHDSSLSCSHPFSVRDPVLTPESCAQFILFLATSFNINKSNNYKHCPKIDIWLFHSKVLTLDSSCHLLWILVWSRCSTSWVKVPLHSWHDFGVLQSNKVVFLGIKGLLDLIILHKQLDIL
jgi:hypothetical protein